MSEVPWYVVLLVGASLILTAFFAGEIVGMFRMHKKCRVLLEDLERYQKYPKEPR